MKLIALSVLALSLASPAAFAAGGSVEVSFVAPERFTDIGFGAGDRKSNLASISEELERLGKRHLDASQQLKVEVLDVDMAGRIPPGSIRDVRVLNGRADWPRIKLRWTLQSAGSPAQQGEETISDMDYLQRLAINRQEPNYYERRLLQDWFKKRFVVKAGEAG